MNRKSSRVFFQETGFGLSQIELSSQETLFPFQRRAEHVEPEATRRAGPCLCQLPQEYAILYRDVTTLHKRPGSETTRGGPDLPTKQQTLLRHPERSVTDTVGKSLNNAHSIYRSHHKSKKEVNTAEKEDSE